MEYFIIISLQGLGIGLHVMQKVSQLNDLHPETHWGDVFKIFYKTDWDTLMVSTLVLCLNLVVHFIINKYAIELTQIKYYHLYSFAVALILGYAGQRLVYRYLGKAEGFLNDKADKLGKK